MPMRIGRHTWLHLQWLHDLVPLWTNACWSSIVQGGNPYLHALCCLLSFLLQASWGGSLYFGLLRWLFRCWDWYFPYVFIYWLVLRCTQVRTYLFLLRLFLYHQWLYLKNLLVTTMIAVTMTKTKALKIIVVQAMPTASMVAPMINNSPISNTMRIAVIANAAKMVIKNLFIFLKF